MTKTLSFITFFLLSITGMLPAHAQFPDQLRYQLDPLAAAEAELSLRPHAGDEVWRALIAGGAPIIRPDPELADHVQAIFLYRSDPEVDEVRLDSVLNAVEVEGRVSDYVRDFTLPMRRVGETQIWARALSLPQGSEAAYSFLVRRGDTVHRFSDSVNPRRLRGADAESVFIAAPQNVHPATRPVPWSARLQPAHFAADSEALARPVFLELYSLPGASSVSPVLVIYDSFLWGVRAPAVEIVQNLVQSGDLPPMHVVLIDQLDEVSARSLYQDQLEFLSAELPRALAERGMLGDRILAGASRRGLVAAMAGLAQPEGVRAVISLSGSFYWSPEGELPEWLARRVPVAGETSPLFILAAGSLEYVETSTNQGHVMLGTNSNMVRTLAEQGHDVVHFTYRGGHDVVGWRTGLAMGLERVFDSD